MKTDVTNYGSMLQNNTRNPQAAGGSVKSRPDNLESKTTKSTDPDYKVELSKEKASVEDPGNVPAPVAPSAPKKPEIEKPKSEIPVETKNVKEVEKIKEVSKDKKVGTERRPLIVFIKGLDLFSSPSKSERGYAGVGKMAESVEGARIYGWDQHDEIIDEVMKTHHDFPVILVGHSFGGDTAVEVADELDSLENNFKKVDLLVTIDSVGFDNDIIPQNVKNHLNVFGENNFFLNDDPHVARRHEMTKVKNILSHLDHTDIDDDKEIQFEIISLIQETLGKKA